MSYWALCGSFAQVSVTVVLLVPAASRQQMQLSDQLRGWEFISYGEAKLAYLAESLGGQETQSQTEKRKKGRKAQTKNLYSLHFTSPHGFCGKEASAVLGMQ